MRQRKLTDIKTDAGKRDEIYKTPRGEKYNFIREESSPEKERQGAMKLA